MKISLLTRSLVLLGLCALTSQAQFGPPGGASRAPGSGIDAGMRKLFGENKAWTATVSIDVKDPRTGATSMNMKMAMLDGKSRAEMDLTQVKSASMPPGAVDQVKAMGLADVHTISRPDKKVSYIIYPGLKGYIEMNLPAEATKTEEQYKMEITELGKETVEGQACVKNKYVVTDDQGKKHEGTVWQATGLKNFPIKLQTGEAGTDVTMVFKEVKFEKPAATQFDPPADFKKHASQQALMQEVMMRMGAGGGFPPVPKQ